MQSKNYPNIQIAIADDHAVVREGLKKLLSQEHDMEFIGESGGGDDAIKLYTQAKPEVLLLDGGLQQKGGLEILHQILRQDARAKVLIFSGQPESQYALPYMKAGASGYLEKSADTDTLIAAIRRVASGKKYISHNIASILAEQLITPQEVLPHEELSVREYQVMLHLASGKTLLHTAEDMGLSSRTISTYRKRIFQKLRLQNNADLVQYAYRNNLLSS